MSDLKKIDFEVPTPYGIYRGAITVFPGEVLTDDYIENEIQRRVSKYIQYVIAESAKEYVEDVDLSGVQNG
jgi:hypothetical protein